MFRTLTLIAALALTACEAPLNLAGVEQEKTKSILRFDMFQAVAANHVRIATVSSSGVRR